MKPVDFEVDAIGSVGLKNAPRATTGPRLLTTPIRNRAHTRPRSPRDCLRVRRLAMPVVLSPATARSKREAHSKLDALLAKLAAKKMQMDRQARRERGEAVSDSDEDDPANDSLGATPPPPTLTPRPPTASVYGSKAYWDDRYADPHVTIGASTAKGTVNNEWYVGFDRLKPLLLAHSARNQRILLLGTGTSTLGENMAENGFARVSAVDYSEASIVAMRNAQRSRVDALRRNPPDKPPPHPFEVDYRVMDVTAMTYPERSFDCVVDKATLDTMCQLEDEPDEAAPPGPPTAHPLADTHAGRMLAESCRVLKPGGRYVCVTYGEPETRLGLLTAPGLEWDVVAQEVIQKNRATFYAYVCRRRTDPEPARELSPPEEAVGTEELTPGVGGGVAAVPVLRDPFHGSEIDLRSRAY